MRNSRNRLHPLALSLQLAIAASAIPSIAGAQSLYAGPGTNSTISGATFNNAETDGETFRAEGGGAISGDATVNSSGDSGTTLVALTGGTISLTDSTITASGADGTGVWSEDEGVVSLKDSNVNASGLRGRGVLAWDGTVDLDGGSVNVGANGGNAILARGASGTVISKNQSLSTAGVSTEVVRAEKGGHATLTGSKALANGSGSRGVIASGAGSRIDATGAEITVDASASHGVVSTGGGTVNLTGSKVASTVNDNRALFATGKGSSITASGTQVTSSGARAFGASVESGAVVRLTDGSSVAVTGNDAYGVTAIDKGSELTVDGSTVTTSGASGMGAVAEGGASLLLTNGSALSTSGTNAHGVRVRSGAVARIEGASEITTSGETAFGAVAEGEGTELTLDGSSIQTSGKTAWGVLAMNGSRLDASNGTAISTSGANAVGVQAESGSAAIIQGGSSVTVTGEDTHGVASLGAGSTLTVDASSVEASGAHSAGAKAVNGAQLTVRNGSTISTKGADNYGVVVTGKDSVLSIAASTVTTSGDRSPAAVVQAGGRLTLDADAIIEATGAESNAIEVTGDGSKVTANQATLTSAKATGIVMAQGTSVELLDTAVTGATHAVGFLANGTTPITAPATLTVSGGALESDGAVLQSQDLVRANVTLADGVTATSSNGELARATGVSTLSLTLRDVELQGDARADPGARLDLTLDNQANLTGAVYNGRQLQMLGGSLWTVTDSSDVSSASNAGQIAFATPTAGTFKTLTVRGDYTGSNGLVTLNTALGDDASPTDKLVVYGSTAGDTRLHVNNAGGAGAYTAVDGIQVVQVAGASNGTFALDGRVVAGANEYLLAQGGKVDPTDGDWYLRSEAPPPVDPVTPIDPVTPVDPVSPADPVAPDPTPVAPVTPVAPSTPLYRPEPAAYLANQAAAVGMFEHSMHDRMGEANLGKRGDDGRTSAAWVRVVRNQMDGRTGEGQLAAGTDNSVLQIGGEIARWNEDSRFHLGLMGGTGRADSLVISDFTDYRAKGKVTGYNLGVYGTWFANAKDTSGLYLDGWLQYGRYDNNVQGDYLAQERYDSHTVAASIEAGYAVQLNEGGKTHFYIEPQAQAIFTDYSASKHVENNGTAIDDVEAGGWTTRLGVRFYGHAAGTAANIVQPFVTLNWWRDEDRNAMSFNDTTLALELPRDRYEAKLGAQAQLGGGWTGWGNLGLTYGAGDYHDVTGQVGLNYRW